MRLLYIAGIVLAVAAIALSCDLAYSWAEKKVKEQKDDVKDGIPSSIMP